jgi:Caspase domain
MVRILALILLLIGIGGAEVAEAKRVALVIGNAKYSNVGSLLNPPRDVVSVVAALKQAGFDVVKTANDLDVTGMTRQLHEFASEASSAEVALVYYAGHGVEVNGNNFLIPVNAKLEKSTDVYFEAVPLDLVRTSVAGASLLKIVILDACRNNPFKLAGANGKRAANRGLGAVETSSSELIVYAAKEGTVAQDGPGEGNSPFATALVSAIKQPGLEVRLLFGKVRDDVLAATNKEQEPFTYTSLGGNAVYLNPALIVPEVAVITPKPTPLPPITVGIDVAWQSVKQSGNKQALEAFATFYAKDPLFGLYGSLVRQSLLDLKAPKKLEPHVLAAIEPPQLPAKPPEIPKAVDRFDSVLVSAIQSELKRVACFAGRSDGKWGSAALAAAAKFNSLVEPKFSKLDPSTELLVALQEAPDRFCVPAVAKEPIVRTPPRIKKAQPTPKIVSRAIVPKAVVKPERKKTIRATRVVTKVATPNKSVAKKRPGRNILGLCPGPPVGGSGTVGC